MEVESFFPEPTQDALVPRASLLCRMIDKMMGSYVRLSGCRARGEFLGCCASSRSPPESEGSSNTWLEWFCEDLLT